MKTETSMLRREDDRRMERLATVIERMAVDVEKMSAALTAVADGSKPLPQCREHKRDIDDIREQLRAQRGFKNKLALSSLAAAAALLVKHLWDKTLG